MQIVVRAGHFASTDDDQPAIYLSRVECTRKAVTFGAYFNRVACDFFHWSIHIAIKCVTHNNGVRGWLLGGARFCREMGFTIYIY